MSSSSVIEDGNPVVQFSGVWIVESTPSASGGSMTGALEQGATASLTFHGTSIAVVGTIEPTGHDETFGQRSHTSYALDGLVVEPDFFPPLFSTRFFNFTFFFQDGLAPGAHELVVTNLNGTGSIGPMVFWLDYFQVEGGGAGGAAVKVPATPLAVREGVLLSRRAGDSSEAQDTKSAGLGSVGAIVGAIMLALLIFHILRMRRRRLQAAMDGGRAKGPVMAQYQSC